MHTTLDKCDFIHLVSSNKLDAAGKTYSDSLLFYYLGQVAISNTISDMLEIGVGGSTSILHELSAKHNSLLYLNDTDISRVNQYCSDLPLQLANSKYKKLIFDSTKLTNDMQLGYVHVDGSKNYEITVSDLSIAVENLVDMGLICQDDYGNNKHPAVTRAVQSLINDGKLTMLCVGDSSAWLCKPGDYKEWIDLLYYDDEFNLLKELLNISNSYYLGDIPEYLYMNAINQIDISDIGIDNINNSSYRMTYFNTIISNDCDRYLTMPFVSQSTIGANIFSSKIIKHYDITDQWYIIKGDTWPELPPITQNDINELPEHIKIELTNMGYDMKKYLYVYKIAEKG